MTIGEALTVDDRSVSKRDAEVLLMSILGCERSHLHTHPEQRLTSNEQRQYETFLSRREQNEPVAYITGQKEFYGRPFKSDHRALIPRPETEGVIEQAMSFLPGHFWAHSRASNKPCPLHILELGTGSGCISVTLAVELAAQGVPATITATDVSGEALELAQENAKVLVPHNPGVVLRFQEASLFNHDLITNSAPYDLIVANLPYVSNTWKMNPSAQPDVIFHEPDVALFGGEDGLTLYRDFFSAAPSYLAEDGRIIIEYGEDQTAEMLTIAQNAFPKKKADVFQDYAGLDRVLVLS